MIEQVSRRMLKTHFLYQSDCLSSKNQQKVHQMINVITTTKKQVESQGELH